MSTSKPLSASAHAAASLSRVQDSGLPANLALISSAFSQSETGLLIISESLEVLTGNPRVAQLLGVKACGASLLQGECPELLYGVQRCLAGSREVLELARLPWRSEIGHFVVECVPWECPPDRLALLLIRSDNERSALRQQLAEANRFESLGRLAGSVAHDFNNLLTGIRGSLSLARLSTEEDANRLAALEAADRATERAGELARNLLAHGRSPAPVTRTSRPESVLRETADLVGNMVEGVRVAVEIDGDLGQADIEPSQLHRVVLNLLMNAQDAVRSVGGGEVRVKASLAMRGASPHGSATRWLRISICDTGPGMNGETQQKIFEPFFTTKPSTGTGLGLASVRSLVEQAGGWLEVESEVALGSTFSVFLPLAVEGVPMSGAKQKSVSGPSPEASHPAPVLSGAGRVLICDDEARLATLTAGLLEEFGYESASVGLGDEALQVLTARNAPVDVLLLDVNLAEGISAAELLEGVSASGNRVPVILTSGLAIEDIPEGLRDHALVASYLAKPYTVEDLVGAISGALEQRVGSTA